MPRSIFAYCLSSWLLRAALKSAGLIAMLAVTAACTSLDEGRSQTIYVPTANGVEAQTVNTGPEPAKPTRPEQDELRRALTKIATYGNGCAKWIAEETGLRDQSEFSKSVARPNARGNIPQDWGAGIASELEAQCILRGGAGYVAPNFDPGTDELVRAVAAVIVDPSQWERGGDRVELIRSIAISTPLYDPDVNYLEQVVVNLFGRFRFFKDNSLNLCGQANCRLLARTCGLMSTSRHSDVVDVEGLREICRFRRSRELREIVESLK